MRSATTLFLILAITSIAHRLHEIRNGVEKAFWALTAAANVFWIVSVTIRIFYGDGSGTEFEEVDAGLPREDGMTWLDVGDLDNNGNLDLVLFAYDGGPQIQTWIR